MVHTHGYNTKQNRTCDLTSVNAFTETMGKGNYTEAAQESLGNTVPTHNCLTGELCRAWSIGETTDHLCL